MNIDQLIIATKNMNINNINFISNKNDRTSALCSIKITNNIGIIINNSDTKIIISINTAAATTLPSHHSWGDQSIWLVLMDCQLSC